MNSSPASETLPRPRANRWLIVKLMALVAAAFAFAFAMVPLYDVLCAATGFNGKTSNEGTLGVGGIRGVAPAPSRIDLSRVVTVEFTGTVMPGLPWEMRPLTPHLDLHPGELHLAKFLVRNTSDRPIVGQAVPSVSPGQAAQHFEKLDCFCFSQQTLAPGESKELPLTFIVKPEIDEQIRTVTLSYAFFNAEGQKTVSKERE
ncbi:MAG TPA: cytochrome c oxidase assembly protein [Accumulibacter sp.]|nr:cytochrome c oxidase assembly protein [Accumulibacter sp.]HMW18707.1 cytochrome c oxidase assembly protein [Accumulibacter sp.]HMX23202.1 cytochrome c oxidase assembly protein [Accumulibacter sp.]HMY07000.1 cytochrome c oxidase assembly protein [Accumulibacter sp.]HNC18594.1 cytochrome c oxidase assembly protein [Accumulibacter sp.]